MSNIATEAKINQNDELYAQYNWFNKSFLPAIKTASKDFFSDLFDFDLISVSKNINILFQGDDYFVTKIRIDKQHDVFFRCSSDAIKIILDNVLGESKKFDLSNITELEAKIISSFNDYLFGNISKFILPPPPKTQKRKSFDTIHLTLFINDKKTKTGAKIIVSLPQVLLNPQPVVSHEEKFNVTNFKTSKIDVKIKVGSTKFPLKEIKNLEKDDIVIFDESNIHTMTLIFKDYIKDFRITPNPGLIISADTDNGGHNMDENSLSQNMWDNIQVEMEAEFEKVKITLGELKNIEEGLVLDLSSVYDNKITLKVEDKPIAQGELVIINDRYGVRVDKVFTQDKTAPAQSAPPPQDPVETEATEHFEAEIPQEEGEEGVEEEFDYSDFELDDQDI